MTQTLQSPKFAEMLSRYAKIESGLDLVDVHSLMRDDFLSGRFRGKGEVVVNPIFEGEGLETRVKGADVYIGPFFNWGTPQFYAESTSQLDTALRTFKVVKKEMLVVPVTASGIAPSYGVGWGIYLVE